MMGEEQIWSSVNEERDARNNFTGIAFMSQLLKEKV